MLEKKSQAQDFATNASTWECCVTSNKHEQKTSQESVGQNFPHTKHYYVIYEMEHWFSRTAANLYMNKVSNRTNRTISATTDSAQVI